jgi:hypothetical protein
LPNVISQSNQDNSFTNVAVRGKVWILTLMLRLLLVQPVQPIDPTRKYTVMAYLLNPNTFHNFGKDERQQRNQNVHHRRFKTVQQNVSQKIWHVWKKILLVCRVKLYIQRPTFPYSALFGEIREIVLLVLQQVLAEEDNWQNNADNRTHCLLDNCVKSSMVFISSTNDLSTTIQDVRTLEKVLVVNFSTMKNPQKRYERFETVAKHVTVVETEDDESILREIDTMFPTYIENYMNHAKR